MNMDKEYLDSYILSIMKGCDAEREKEKSLGYRIKIHNQYVTLTDREIPQYLTMRLPADFNKNSGNEAGLGYIIKNRPETVFSSNCKTVHFTFDTADTGADTMIDVRKKLINCIRADYPHYVIYDSGRQEAGEIAVDWFEFRSFASDSEVYNIMFLIPIRKDGLTVETVSAEETVSAVETVPAEVAKPKHETIIGTFKCIWRESGTWKPYVLKMLSTIKTNMTGGSTN